MLAWLYFVSGIGGKGAWYAFWSGIGSDFAEITIVGFLAGLISRHICHVRRCYRLSWHPIPVPGTHYRTCHHHATAKYHEALRKKHAAKWPEQHEYLNQGDQ